MCENSFLLNWRVVQFSFSWGTLIHFCINLEEEKVLYLCTLNMCICAQQSELIYVKCIPCDYDTFHHLLPTATALPYETTGKHLHNSQKNRITHLPSRPPTTDDILVPFHEEMTIRRLKKKKKRNLLKYY